MTIAKTRIPTADSREVRTFSTKLEARDNGAVEFKVEGYASVVDSQYDMGGYTETIARGAFDKSLASRPDLQLLVNHEGLPLARTTVPPGQPGHLSLGSDYRGLHFAAQLDRDDPDAVTLMRKIGSGLMDQCSFAFRVIRQDWSDDRSQRTIQEVSLDRGDVSVVNYGASPATSVDARSRARYSPAVAKELTMYQARLRAHQLRGGPVSRDRHLSLLNEAGRSGPITMAEARAIALRLRGQQR